MVKVHDGGVWLLDGSDLIPDDSQAAAKIAARQGSAPGKEEAARQTIAWGILDKHNTSGDDQKLRIRFDKLTSHDITFVGIIQTARASGLEKFPMPYVLTNCHNSLCAVGGTINEDDHVFGLSCAKRYGGIYVPPHQAVIHQFAREMLATGGGMILGSDSHTRYGALGTMAMGEGGPELVKQLLNQTYDINRPGVVAVYLTGEPRKGVGPQDVALALIGAVFESGYVNNRVLEFVGPGVARLTADFRIGVDVMTTETTCLSSIWQTDDTIKAFYEIHGRAGDYKALAPGRTAYYDGCVEIDLSAVEPMIAMPFHPSNTYTIHEVQQNLSDVLADVEKKAKVSLGEKVSYSLHDKIIDGKLYVEQGIIAGCAGGGYENICDAADILKGSYIGADAFTLSVYPASTPIYRQLAVNGKLADLIEAGAVVKTAFCGPCFGAGDTPANGMLSIRHSTRNFPNREGSKLTEGQIASVALMDARSIAATAANKGFLTAATDVDVSFTRPAYYFDSKIYENRVFDSKGVANPDEPIVLGPNIKDWPVMQPLPENLLLKVVSEIHDPVTTTDELIPSGETSSYRSNPLRLAEFALSRKDPAYVGRAKEVQKAQRAIEAGEKASEALPELKSVMDAIHAASQAGLFKRSIKQTPAQEDTGAADALEKASGADCGAHKAGSFGVGSAIFAVKPGDGSAREQAASCQKVLGGWANIAHSYATKRYRSNLINWGMLPLLIDEGTLPFANGDYVYLPGIRQTIVNQESEVSAYAVRDGQLRAFRMRLGELTANEREIILKGCLINYNRVG